MEKVKKLDAFPNPSPAHRATSNEMTTQIVVTGKIDNGSDYMHHAKVAKYAIRYAFSRVQEAQGNQRSIRVTRKFIKCEYEGNTITYTNNGNTVEVLERSYDTLVNLDGHMEVYAKEIKFWSPE